MVVITEPVVTMEAYIWLTLSLAVVVHGSPVPNNDTIEINGDKEPNVSGFFIPMDTWNSFQNQLQPKPNEPTPTNQDSNVIKLPNQPSPDNPTDVIGDIKVYGNGNVNNIPKFNKPVIFSRQPGAGNPQVLQPGQIIVNQDPKTGQMYLIPSGTVQGNQAQVNKPVILMPQPAQNPIVLPQQPSQPLYVQPGQSFVIQNGVDGKPILVAVPATNQGSYVQPSQKQGPVYTLVVNGQNPNPSQNGNLYPSQNGNLYPSQNGNLYHSQNGNLYPSQNGNIYPSQNGNVYPNQNGNLYLVPVQSGGSNPIVLRPAK